MRCGVGHRCGLEACTCSSDSTPSLGTSICYACGPKKQKKKEKEKVDPNDFNVSFLNVKIVIYSGLRYFRAKFLFFFFLLFRPKFLKKTFYF